MRDDEYKTSDLYLDSTELFNRLAQRIQDPNSPLEPFKKIISYGTGKLLHKNSEAKHKILGKTTNNWIEKRGIKNENINSFNTSKVILAMLDTENKGFISGETFCEFLIEIGLPLDCKNLYSLLCKIKRSENIKNVMIGYEDLSNFCRGDHRTNSLLESLKTTVKEQIKTEENPKINIILLEKLLKSWWKECDIYNYNQVHINEVSKLLVNKSVVCDFNEGYHIIKKIIQNNYLDYLQFKLIFGKAMIKDKFSSNDWENSEFSQAYKLTQLKKQLILAGIEFPVPFISLEEGRSTLEAIEKYAKFKNKTLTKMSYHSFHQLWFEFSGELIGKNGIGKGKTFDLKTSDDPFNGNRVKAYSLIGNLDTKINVLKKWNHSFSPKILKKKKGKKLNFSSLESKIQEQDKSLRFFLNLVNHEQTTVINSLK